MSIFKWYEYTDDWELSDLLNLSGRRKCFANSVDPDETVSLGFMLFALFSILSLFGN